MEAARAPHCESQRGAGRPIPRPPGTQYRPSKHRSQALSAWVLYPERGRQEVVWRRSPHARRQSSCAGNDSWYCPDARQVRTVRIFGTEEDKMKRLTILVLLAATSTTLAAGVNVAYDPGTTNVTQGLAGFRRSGGMIVGSVITGVL